MSGVDIEIHEGDYELNDVRHDFDGTGPSQRLSVGVRDHGLGHLYHRR